MSSLKRILFSILIVVVVFFVSCKSADKNKCYVQGVIKNNNRKAGKLNLLIIYPDNIQLLSSVKVNEDGEFELAVPNKVKTIYAVARAKEFIYFVNDAETIKIETDASEFDNYTIDGSVGSEQIKELTKTYKKLATDLNIAENLLLQKMSFTNGVVADKETRELEHKTDKITIRLKNYVKNYIDTANPIFAINAAIYLSREDDYYYLQKLIEKYKSFSEDVLLASSLTNLLAEQNAVVKNTRPMQDIVAMNTELKRVKVNTLGKYTLVNFWSSWCYYSVEEQKYFKNVCDKYKNNENFQFVNLSIDNSLEEWKALTETNNIKANYNLVDTMSWKSKAMEDLGLSFLPACYLLDKDGKIITKNMRGKEIEMALDEFVNVKK